MTDKIDAEIRAMKTISKTLDSLEPKAQLRALAYMVDKYGTAELARPLWDAATMGKVSP